MQNQRHSSRKKRKRKENERTDSDSQLKFENNFKCGENIVIQTNGTNRK